VSAVAKVHPVATVSPDEPAAVRFMNTVWADRAGVHDALADRDDLVTVLDALGSPSEVEVTEPDLRRARRLRDALRRIAASETDDDRPRALTDLSLAAALDEVNQSLGDRPSGRLEHTGAGWRWDTGTSTVRHALAELAREGSLLFAQPDHPVRACRAPGCVLYFIQQHGRREWCSPECGNRARAARHYARHGRAGRG